MVGGSSSFWAQRRDSKWLARFVPSHAACRLDDMDNETRQYLVLGAAPNLSSQHRSMSRRIKSSQSPGQSRESRGNRESRLTAETTRLDSLNSTRLDWAELNLALQRLASQRAVEPRPSVPGVPSSPSNKRKQSDCVPFLNGILLATEENHTATVLVPCPVLIRRCYMLPSVPRPESSSPTLLLHHLGSTYRSSAPLVSVQSSHPPPPPTLPPRPTLPLSVQCSHRHLPHIAPLHTHIHTQTYTHAHIQRFRPHLFLIMERQSPPLPSYQLSNTLASGAAHSRSNSTRRENNQAEASAVQPFSA